ncbi:hypothetical protein CBL_13662 [Carabus blaptoides fortunei]
MKRVRANLSPETVIEYFENWKPVLDGVAPENITNYDETNITGDPSKVELLVKRGNKHARKKLDSFKQSTSMMFAASGIGTLVPLYIELKIYILNGCKGALRVHIKPICKWMVRQ